MKKYRVYAEMTTTLYLDVEAESEDHAMSIGENSDGGDFIELGRYDGAEMDNYGAWDVTHVTEINKKHDCDRCKDEMRIKDYENGDRYSEDGKMPCPDCQGG